MATDRGDEPVAKSTLGAKLFMSIPTLLVLLLSTETVFEPTFAVAKSGLPSPSKSPMATDRGYKPVAKSTLGAKLFMSKLPLPDLLRNTETIPK